MAERIEITVPDIGDFENVEIIDVLVKAGDDVEKETPLITLETDKAAMDIPSPASGKIVEMKVGNGDKVSEGTVIAVLDAAAAGADKAEPKSGPNAEEKPKQEEKVVEEEQDQPAPGKAQAVEEPREAVRPPADLPEINEAAFSRAHASPSV